MKRSFLAAGVGLCIFAATMVVSNHPANAQQPYNGNVIAADTTPKRDTTKKPDTLNLAQLSVSSVQQ
jgi:hypothetical protein